MKRINRSALVFWMSLLILGPSLYLSAQDEGYTETGMASFYADKFEGKTTASGEKYYHSKLTAAHPTLPFGTIVKVTNIDNKKTVAVRINDRGPFKDNRIIDLSLSAAKKLDIEERGLAKVRIKVINHIDDAFDDQDNTRRYFYNLKLKKTVIKQGEYAIQLASFHKMRNLIQTVNDLDEVQRDRIHFEIVNKNDKEELFRLIYGMFSDRSSAEKARREVRRQFPDCFVVTF